MSDSVERALEEPHAVIFAHMPPATLVLEEHGPAHAPVHVCMCARGHIQPGTSTHTCINALSAPYP